MTSAKSLKNKSAALYDFKRSMVNLTPMIALLIFAMVWLFIIPIHNEFSIDYGTKMLLGGRFERRAIVYNVVFGALGMLGALSSFSFLLSKKQISVYLSMGITRKQLFKSRVLAFLIRCAEAICLSMAIAVAININLFGFSTVIIQHGAVVALALYAMTIIGFAVGLLAIFLAANVFEFAIFAGTLYAIPTVILHSITLVLCNVLGVFCVGRTGFAPIFAKGEDVMTRLSLLNPLTLSVKIGATAIDDDVFSRSIVSRWNEAPFENLGFSYIAPILIWIALSGVIIFASYKLFEKRNAEIAGKLGMKNSLAMLCAFFISFFAALLSLDYTFIAGRASIVIATIIFIGLWCLLSLAFSLNKSVAGKNARVIFGLGAALCALLFVISFDAVGYKKRIPKAENIETAYISVQAEDYLSGTRQYYTGKSTSGICNAYLNYNEIGPIKSQADMEQLVKIVDGIANGEGEKVHTNVYVRFETRDGKTILRNYNYVTEEALLSILSLYDGEWRDDMIERAFLEESTKFYAQKGKRNYAEEWYFNHDGVMLVDPLSSQKAYESYFENDEELKAALVADLKAQTAAQLFMPTEPPIAILTYANARTGEPSLEGKILIYSYMENTMAYFEKHKLFDVLSSLDMDIVKADVISVRDYNAASPNYKIEEGMLSRQFISTTEYYRNNDFVQFSGDMADITDPELIAELKKNAVFTYYIADGKGYYVRFWQKYGPMVYLYLPEDKLPEALK